MVRTQITMDPELHRRARRKASELGISLAEYVRRLVADDLAVPTRTATPAVVFNLGRSGSPNTARDHDEALGRAVADDHPGYDPDA